MRIAVVGLGKIGLPLAVQYARKGHDVHGVDVNAATVEAVSRGVEPFPGEAHLRDYLAEVLAAGGMRATIDYSQAIPGADVVVVVVPLFVDAADQPDFTGLDGATESIGQHLTAGTLVVYETTLPVGTTRTRWQPALEKASGLVEGRDFHIAFSPERVLTGRVFADLRRYPKLVGGLSAEGAKLTADFYEAVLDFDERTDLDRPNGVWDLGSAEAAELAKLAETTYRDVNIALANQFAKFAEKNGIDVYEVIKASNSQPYSHIHQPGISVGGHCIPVYPRLYLWNDPDADLVSTARDINASMPGHVVDLLRGALDIAGVAVLVLGVSYRGGVKETSFSGVFAVVSALAALGAHVVVHDPMYTADELIELGLVPYRLGDPVAGVIVHSDHEAYSRLRGSQFPGVQVVVDGRGIVDRTAFRGVKLLTLGAPS